MTNVHCEGNISEEILDQEMPIRVAVTIRDCDYCRGSGYKKYGWKGECGEPDELPIKCDCCNGKGKVIDISNAIRVVIKTVVEVEEKT